MRSSFVGFAFLLFAGFLATFSALPVPDALATAEAPPCSTSALWGFQTAQQFLPRAASARPYGLDLTILSAGTILYGLWGETTTGPGAHTGGTVKWSVPAPFGVTYEDDPIVARLSFGGGTVVLSTTSEGRVICLDALTGAIRWLSPRVRRATCGDDTIEGAPAVQLWDESNAAFRAAIPDDDLVFVVTSYNCGTSTENRVYAFNGSDGTTRWVFNDPQVVDMDFASEGCVVDPATNHVYCGTNLPAVNPAQHTAWALDSRDGSFEWSRNLGSVHNRPQIGRGTGHVYIGEDGGTLRALVAATGATDWSRDLTPSTADNILKTVWSEFRPPFGDHVYGATGDGALHALLDGGGSTVTELWLPAPNGGFTTAPAVNVPTGKLYVGRSDGRVQEVNLGSGLLETTVLIKTDAPVTAVALDSAGTASAPDRLMAAAGGLERRHCIPWTVTVDAGPSGPGDARAGAVAFLGAFPNPFRAGSALAYRLASAGDVAIAIYDARGAQVRALDKGAREPGDHRATWDGTDDAGRAVASGLYYVRLTLTGGGEVVGHAERALLRLR